MSDLRGAFAAMFDDAAIFPPGNATMAEGVRRHHEYRRGALDDVVGPFICPLSRQRELLDALHEFDDPIDIAFIVAAQVDDLTHLARASSRHHEVAVCAVEVVVSGSRRQISRSLDQLAEYRRSFGAAVYVESTALPASPEHLAAIADRELGLKFRTGGVIDSAYPTDGALGVALASAVSAGVPFKCTAGMHHAVRHRGTEDGFEHHGFGNVLLATEAALAGGDEATVRAALAERDGAAVAARLLALGPEGPSHGAPVVCLIRDLQYRGAVRGPRRTRTADAAMTWLGIGDDHLYGVDNLPIASLVDRSGHRFAGVRIGDHVLDLCRAGADPALFPAGALDLFLAAGRPIWGQLRAIVAAWLTDEVHRRAVEVALVPIADVTPVLGFTIGDYVDFYASEHHASNVGRMFRPDGAALPSNWKHLPIGYHGRCGTVVVSGTDVRRPCGQAQDRDGSIRFGPSQRLDIEAEVAFVVGAGSDPGRPVPLLAFEEHVFGVCLLNDWSARDIQTWEYVPLGPFLGKSFATSIAGWITPLAALSSARVKPPARAQALLPYLDDSADDGGLDIAIEVRLNGDVIARPPYAGMYWTPAQMLAHLTANGAHVRSGDLYASGTVSGADRFQRGSMLELSWNGTDPIQLRDGTTRSFLADGDEVVLSATATGPRGPIGLGEVRGTVTQG